VDGQYKPQATGSVSVQRTFDWGGVTLAEKECVGTGGQLHQSKYVKKDKTNAGVL